jgi:feruloyl esterase
MEVQRYPRDFDGVIAGAPSFGVFGYVRRALVYRAILAAPDRALPPAKIELLSKAVVTACDASDGLVDGLVGDPRLCTFDPQALRCQRGDAPDCLTPGQLDAIAAVREDSVLPNGQRLRGMPLGHEAGDSGWPLWITGKKPPLPSPDGRLQYDEEPPIAWRFADGFFRYMAFAEDDPSYDFRRFDAQTELDKLAAIIPILSPTDPNLARFAARDGKLLLYHGWADPGLSAYATLDYYDKVVASAGGKKKADAFVRMFLVPGMHHCAGGPGPDTFDRLTALEQWVEKGIAPAKLIATHSTAGVVDRTRPLCPEPQRARYVGTGSIDAAENFTCEAPAASASTPAAGTASPP